ncbi:NAD(P)-binding domain-containing protein, partial [Candidatus Saccharibacteria bacterium]|nr:NAD(P)-binding domain-containing protein [Candidatus Saccharibacteria bacterium]
MKIAVHGLGRMGMQIARKLAESGQHEVIAHNRSPEPIDEAVTYGAVAAYTVDDVVTIFGDDPADVWVMLPAEITADIIRDWAGRLKPGSIIINGANYDYRQESELNELVKQAGMQYADIGVSGGVWGYQNGFPLMCGSDEEAAYETLKPALDTLAAP